jgi:hypothetical protein
MRPFIFAGVTSLALGLIAAGPIHDTSDGLAPVLLYRRFASRELVEPISFVRQASAAAVLVTLGLSLQSGGMAALIRWGRGHFARRMYGLEGWRGAVFMVRFTGSHWLTCD